MLLTFIRLLLIDFTDDLIQDYCLVGGFAQPKFTEAIGYVILGRVREIFLGKICV